MPRNFAIMNPTFHKFALRPPLNGGVACDGTTAEIVPSDHAFDLEYKNVQLTGIPDYMYGRENSIILKYIIFFEWSPAESLVRGFQLFSWPMDVGKNEAETC